MTAKAILGIIPGLQATSLVAMNIPKNFPMKSTKKFGMKKQTKNFVKTSVGTLTGIGLMKPTSELINAF